MDITTDFLFSLRGTIEFISEQKILIDHPAHPDGFLITNPSLALCDFLAMLEDQANCQKSALEQIFDGRGQSIDFVLCLNKLISAGLLNCSLVAGGKTLLDLFPLAPGLRVLEHRLRLVKRWKLSQYCFFKLQRIYIACESPLGACRILICPEVFSLLQHNFVEPTTLNEVKTKVRHFNGEVINSIVVLLDAAGVLVDENSKEKVSTWEFHDLLLHNRSRKGFHNEPVGGTYRFKSQENKISPLPVIKPVMSDDKIQLLTPDERSFQDDLPFQSVLERRKSIRISGKNPVSYSQVSEFLYRSFRQKIFKENTPYAAYPSRNYPCAGALYENEVYLVVNRCEGLEKGFYHYRPLDHVLEKLSVEEKDCKKMLSYASAATLTESTHDILFIFAARFSRMAWKYEGMAYAAMLKHVGVLMQTFYLVATAMGLAPCAVGNGDSALFAKMTGLDFYEEGSIGEFVLNSMPEDMEATGSAEKEVNIQSASTR